MAKNNRRLMLAGMVVLVVALGLAAAYSRGAFGGGTLMAGAKDGGGKDGKKPEPTLEFAAREVVHPTLVRMPELIAFSGPLVAPQTAMLRAKTAGTLLNLNVAEGNRVNAGQVLGRIEMAELGSRVAERNALLASAQASLGQAQRLHDSNQRLATQQFISPIALQNSQSALDTARANLAAAQAALDTTRVAVRDATLVAPIAGIVAKRHVLPGEKLSPEQQVLTIVDIRQLELAGTVGTHEVGRLKAGLPVEVRVEGIDAPVTGEIARIAPAAEPGTRSIGVTIALTNRDERLRAGQYAVASVTLADPTERLTLPRSAVGSTAGQDHVWLVEGGVLARRAVTLGRADAREGRVEILSGVQAGSQVLAARFDNLREGAKARVLSTDGAARASAVASASPTSAPSGTTPGVAEAVR
ncbi:MAG: efflux RND transporter periplasmic adaptor subunit [Rubrivivax sp.]